MKLPPKILTEINQLGNSFEPKKVRVSQKVIKTPKERVITIPNGYLKEKQRELHRLLLSIKIPKPVFSQKGLFFADKARFHLGDEYLINIDIKDFYPSIHYQRIAKIFSNLRVKKNVIKKITFMTTYKNCLPQGFVTSPILSNFVMFSIDNDLLRYTKHRKIKYSRYVDDITFSSNQRMGASFLEKISKIIRASGFRINKSKTESFGPSDTKIVLGLRLEEDGINITDKYLEKVISHLEELKILAEDDGDYQNLKPTVIGELNFIKQIKPSVLRELLERYSFVKTI